MGNTTQYTDDEAANALAVLEAYGGNAKRASQATGIPRTTLRQWAGRAHSTTAHPKVVPTELVEDRRTELGRELQAIAVEGARAVRALIPQISGDKDSRASTAVKDGMIAVGIATERAELVLGRPTSRNESLNVTLVASGSLNELGERTLTALRRR